MVGTAEHVLVPAIEYRINQSSLLRNGFLLAREIEDLQIAYLFDFNDDNVIAGNEVRGDQGGTDYVASAQSIADLREVRINFVARTRQEDPTFPTGQFIATENRDPINVNDGFRRRVHTSLIMPRNLINRMAGI